MRERFITKMRAARIRKGWTQAALAKRVYVSRVEVLCYERGRHAIPLDTAQRIGGLLGLAPDELQAETDVPAENNLALAAWFRDMRRALGLSTRDVSALSGVTNISHAENGEAIGAWTMVRLRDFFEDQVRQRGGLRE